MELSEISEDFVIKNASGLHLRPAAQIVKLAATFNADVYMEKDDLKVSAKSIMGLTALQGICGDTLKISASGEQANDVLKALGDLINSGFGEDE